MSVMPFPLTPAIDYRKIQLEKKERHIRTGEDKYDWGNVYRQSNVKIMEEQRWSRPTNDCIPTQSRKYLIKKGYFSSNSQKSVLPIKNQATKEL